MGKKAAKAATSAATGADDGFVTVRIPIGQLREGGGYGESRSFIPRQLRSRHLTPRQGIVLSQIRLGMVSRGEALDRTQTHFISGGKALKAVETKEETICRLLEIIGDAIDQASE